MEELLPHVMIQHTSISAVNQTGESYALTGWTISHWLVKLNEVQHASSPAPAQTTRLQNARQHQLHQTVRLHRAPTRCTRFTRNTPRNACQEFHLVENTRTFVHSHSCRQPAAAASSLLLPAPHFTTPAAHELSLMPV